MQATLTSARPLQARIATGGDWHNPIPPRRISANRRFTVRTAGLAGIVAGLALASAGQAAAAPDTSTNVHGGMNADTKSGRPATTTGTRFMMCRRTRRRAPGAAKPRSVRPTWWPGRTRQRDNVSTRSCAHRSPEQDRSAVWSDRKHVG